MPNYLSVNLIIIKKIRIKIFIKSPWMLVKEILFLKEI